MGHQLSGQHWDLALRGAVAALLLHHLLHLLLPGPRRQARWALAGFVCTVLAYLACQQAGFLLQLPRALAYALLTGCVGSAAWLWAATRALFDDAFRFSLPLALVIAAVTLLGLAANVPYFPAGDGPFRIHPAGSAVVWLGHAHALAMLGFSAAALWEALRGWRADLVASRRALRRWAVVGVVGYSGAALVIELALRGAAVGRLLPALHVAVIGVLAMVASLVVARGSLADVLGSDAAPVPPVQPSQAGGIAPPTPSLAGAPLLAALPERSAQALARLDAAMQQSHAYRQEGLSLADLARSLGLAEAPLRTLINQQLGFRNFNDFLHHHRLNEAMARLASSDLPVLTVALDCGYGSIGPFNRAFKQRLGMTPTDYRAAIRIGAIGQPGPGSA